MPLAVEQFVDHVGQGVHLRQVGGVVVKGIRAAGVVFVEAPLRRGDVSGELRSAGRRRPGQDDVIELE